MNLDLEGAIIVFARFVRMASVLPCLAARRDIFNSVFGAPLGTSVALGPCGCTEKSMRTKKMFSMVTAGPSIAPEKTFSSP